MYFFNGVFDPSVYLMTSLNCIYLLTFRPIYFFNGGFDLSVYLTTPLNCSTRVVRPTPDQEGRSGLCRIYWPPSHVRIDPPRTCTPLTRAYWPPSYVHPPRTCTPLTRAPPSHVHLPRTCLLFTYASNFIFTYFSNCLFIPSAKLFIRNRHLCKYIPSCSAPGPFDVTNSSTMTSLTLLLWRH